MLGGYQILDLTNIDLEITTSAEDITDSGVLKQLLNLREYIDEHYDFTRPLNNKLKPLLIRLRDAEENEEIEASVWGNLSVTKEGFVISANVLQNPLLQLQLFVSFEKAYDDDGNAYWIIDDAKIMLSNSLNITGELQAFEEITDKDGHKRNTGGDINLTDNTPAGITKTYGKWSLSGTHLLMVLGLELTANTYASSEIATFTLPEWIYNKVDILFQSSVADRKIIPAWDNNYGSQNLTFTLNKLGNNTLQIGMSGATLSADRKCRIAFDFLIDNE